MRLDPTLPVAPITRTLMSETPRDPPILPNTRHTALAARRREDRTRVSALRTPYRASAPESLSSEGATRPLAVYSTVGRDPSPLYCDSAPLVFPGRPTARRPLRFL